MTAWWNQTRREIQDTVATSLRALDEWRGDFVPVAHECRFGGAQPLVVKNGRDQFMLHGIIDRVDRAPDGSIRIVDYKTGGPSSFKKKAGLEGKKLQLALYALAARDALHLGNPVDGFYWHIKQGERSEFRLGGGDETPEDLIGIAVEAAWQAVRGVREGDFSPNLSDPSCPPYCPVATFCWHYRAGFGG